MFPFDKMSAQLNKIIIIVLLLFARVTGLLYVGLLNKKTPLDQAYIFAGPFDDIVRPSLSLTLPSFSSLYLSLWDGLGFGLDKYKELLFFTIIYYKNE